MLFQQLFNKIFLNGFVASLLTSCDNASSNIEADRSGFLGRRRGGGGAEEGRKRGGGEVEEGWRRGGRGVEGGLDFWGGGGAEKGRKRGGGGVEEGWREGRIFVAAHH